MDAGLGLPARVEFLLDDLPAPYHHLNGQGYDGLKLYQQRRSLGLGRNPAFAGISESAAHWDSENLHYNADFQVSATPKGEGNDTSVPAATLLQMRGHAETTWTGIR